jgi:hypothetical protein
MELTEIKREPRTAIDDRATLAHEAASVLKYDLLRKELGNPPRLLSILHQLEIDVLNERDVAEYQKAQMREIAQEKFTEWLEDANLHSASLFHCPFWRVTPIEDYNSPIPQFALRQLVQIKDACPEAVVSIVALDHHPDPFARVELMHPSWKEEVLETIGCSVGMSRDSRQNNTNRPNRRNRQMSSDFPAKSMPNLNENSEAVEAQARDEFRRYIEALPEYRALVREQACGCVYFKSQHRNAGQDSSFFFKWHATSSVKC